MGDVAGTGKKPAPQKGRGMGRVGNRRAPQRSGGAVAHGPIRRELTEKLNSKVRNKALQIMLSAKLYEERIILIESESIDFFKTKYLSEVLKPYLGDRLTFLVPFDADDKFIRASKNIPNLFVRNP